MLPTRLLILSILCALPLAAQQRQPRTDGPLSGTYVVGEAGSDFATIGAAVDELRGRGVSGPVTIEVRTGCYGEALTIDAIPGVDSLHAITFRGIVDVDGSLPVIEGLPAAGRCSPPLLLHNARWITIRGLHLKSQHCAEAVIRIDSSRNVEIAECLIEGAPEVIPDSLRSAGIAMRASENVRIEKNRIGAVETGVHVTGGSVSDDNVRSLPRCTITENEIGHTVSRGIVLDQASGYRIEANRITIEATRAPATGIDVERCNGPAAIERNVVVVRTPEGCGIAISQADPPDTLAVRVVNNMVSLLLGEHTGLHMSAGISLIESPHAEILHNSVLVQSTGVPMVRPAGLYLWGTSAASITILNNVFAVTGGPALHWTGRPGTWRRDQAGIVCDYNDLFADGGPGIINASRELQPVGALTMEEWRRMAGTDRHSFAVPPDFIGPEDLHGSAGTWRDDRLKKGLSLHTVPADIDGDPRDPVHPAVGADEPR